MKLKFFSTDRGVSRLVTDYFEKFGELFVVSIKAQNGHHELIFKVSRDYSIRSVTTDLIVKISGVNVEVEYLEDDMNFDYYEQDLDLLQEIQTSLEMPKGIITEQSTFFHNMGSARGSVHTPCDSKTVELLDKMYIVYDDDDFLSELDDEESIIEDPSVEACIPKVVSFPVASNGLDFFNNKNNRLTLTRLNSGISPVVLSNHSCSPHAGSNDLAKQSASRRTMNK